jgi:hypothetical protein
MNLAAPPARLCGCAKCDQSKFDNYEPDLRHQSHKSAGRGPRHRRCDRRWSSIGVSCETAILGGKPDYRDAVAGLLASSLKVGSRINPAPGQGGQEQRDDRRRKDRFHENVCELPQISARLIDYLLRFRRNKIGAFLHEKCYESPLATIRVSKRNRINSRHLWAHRKFIPS